jgi:DNA-binding transcriptional MocR family regulator
VPEQYPIRGSSSREIARSVEASVASGALAPGAKLPSVRTLAARLGVSPTTVASALAELRWRGLVVSRPRSGVRVADRPPLTMVELPVPPGVRDLAGGSPDPAFLPDVHRALRSLSGPPLLYGEAAVTPELRAVAASALAADGLDATHLCVLNGALDAVERVLGAHLAGGDPVAVEDPGFAGVIDLVRALGLAPLPVAVDERGMRPDALARSLGSGARAVIVTPRGQNPTGAALDRRRAGELRRVLARHPGVLLVEDDHLGPVAGAGALTLTGGRELWAAIRSTSKWLGPDLRLAVLAGDERTVRRVEGRQALGPGWVSTLVQRTVATLWGDEETAALVAQAATVYAGRRRALEQALAVHGIRTETASGLNVWIPVPSEEVVVRGLLTAGWAVTAGSRFRLRSAPAIRVTVATLRPDEAGAFAADLAAVLRPAGRTRAA